MSSPRRALKADSIARSGSHNSITVDCATLTFPSFGSSGDKQPCPGATNHHPEGGFFVLDCVHAIAAESACTRMEIGVLVHVKFARDSKRHLGVVDIPTRAVFGAIGWCLVFSVSPASHVSPFCFSSFPAPTRPSRPPFTHLCSYTNSSHSFFNSPTTLYTRSTRIFLQAHP